MDIIIYQYFAVQFPKLRKRTHTVLQIFSFQIQAIGILQTLNIFLYRLVGKKTSN